MTPYENLANAIIVQAVKDYRQTRNPADRATLERFFRSEWFSILTKLDGEALIEQLRKEAVKQ